VRRRAEHLTHEQTGPLVPSPSRPSQSPVTQLLALQRQAGNRAVAAALKPSGPQAPRLPGTPIALQRKAGTYEAGERAPASAGRGILAPDVTLLSATGSGYDAAANSVVVADFAPGSARQAGAVLAAAQAAVGVGGQLLDIVGLLGRRGDDHDLVSGGDRLGVVALQLRHRSGRRG
jgi:hypothetical protein